MDSYLSFDDECNIIAQFLSTTAFVLHHLKGSSGSSITPLPELVEFIYTRAQQNNTLITTLQSRRLVELIKANPELALTSKSDIVRELAIKVYKYK